MILNNEEIQKLCEAGMITPFNPHPVRKVDDKKVISFGMSSMGYDIRIDRKFKIFSPTPTFKDHQHIVDPKNIKEEYFKDFEGDEVVLPPHSYLLGVSVERFKMPEDVMTICVGKSTYARCGVIVNVTPLEPEWEGYLVIEVSNASPLPVKIYAGEGIAQLLFFKGNTPLFTYKDKEGKYQGQTGITLPKM